MSSSTAVESPQNPSAPLAHIPALDGLRAFAILLVIVRHASLEQGAASRGFLGALGNAGWMGVDLFFVLSGFLITRILIQSKGSTYYFRNFYLRRSFRIFPLYYAVLVGLFVVAPIASHSPAVQELARHQIWYWTYTVNFLAANTNGEACGLHTVHFWSLSVEEQFYLIWPAVVFFVPSDEAIATETDERGP